MYIDVKIPIETKLILRNHVTRDLDFTEIEQDVYI